ncbi:30S ribosomal protein S17e [Methanonatronarchaeum sp. AMET-Sl]|uniref:30S ribosomal protein S17e n=1 Tax=Methanonatronarchaeum sp. AMET-Sl TaxID=3037654 RepID=UPI00244E4CCA|nr:30S ribosomal protein S17e [Methanonatronarchaeum sp. AMET-Sl]WGI16843.1 30S ribosomal protein S17e [Methanonatronarchaeum sp. AMET-Sl]
MDCATKYNKKQKAGEILGRSRPKFIRSIGEELIKYHGEKFSDNFEKNKEMVDELTNVQSKRLRNRIAGIITKKNSQNTVNEENKVDEENT